MRSAWALRGYGGLIADGARMAAHRAALAQTVRPGSIVVDLGAGFGIMALVACQLGAKRVYAVEPNALVEVARDLAASNGFGDRLRIIQDVAERVSLPEPADVLISDLRGVLPFHRRHLPIIMDVRRRLLARDGVLIPGRDEVKVAIVSQPSLHERCRAPWRDGAPGLDMSPAETLAVNELARATFSADEVVAPPRTWATLDYRTVASPSANGTLVWKLERAGTAHGLGLWFDTTLVPGVGFSNGPGAPTQSYGAIFLPWSQPVTLSAGDEITVDLRADLMGDNYVWTWNTTVDGAGRPPLRLRQSTFLGQPLSSSALRRRHPERVARLNEDGEVAAFVLGQMGERLTVAEIALRLRARFPERFADGDAALAEVGTFAERYGA